MGWRYAYYTLGALVRFFTLAALDPNLIFIRRCSSFGPFASSFALYMNRPNSWYLLAKTKRLLKLSI